MAAALFFVGSVLFALTGGSCWDKPKPVKQTENQRDSMPGFAEDVARAKRENEKLRAGQELLRDSAIDAVRRYMRKNLSPRPEGFFSETVTTLYKADGITYRVQGFLRTKNASGESVIREYRTDMRILGIEEDQVRWLIDPPEWLDE